MQGCAGEAGEGRGLIEKGCVLEWGVAWMAVPSVDWRKGLMGVA